MTMGAFLEIRAYYPASFLQLFFFSILSSELVIIP